MADCVASTSTTASKAKACRGCANGCIRVSELASVFECELDCVLEVDLECELESVLESMLKGVLDEVLTSEIEGVIVV